MALLTKNDIMLSTNPTRRHRSTKCASQLKSRECEAPPGGRGGMLCTGSHGDAPKLAVYRSNVGVQCSNTAICYLGVTL